MKAKKMLIFGVVLSTFSVYAKLNYPIVDTAQIRCYDNQKEIKYPKKNSSFYGQDAQYKGNQPKYRNNNDGTITDLVTGLMWQRDPGSKKSYYDAVKGATKCRTGGYSDWRMPTIKELYSLICFNGKDVDPNSSPSNKNKPFINTKYFKFSYGSGNERIIDSQYATSTIYKGKTMGGNETMFGVNLADGRIKGYPTQSRRNKKYYVMYVRGNKNYGKNNFVFNKNGIVSDKATGLMWAQQDSQKALNWKDALNYAENSNYAGYSDWRLPNAKELQSIVDYNRSLQSTNSPAINPVFKCTVIKDEGGKKNYGFYWSSTTHVNSRGASNGVSICFGEALGFMEDRRSGKGKTLMDVHGAGAQRSDPKSGNASNYPYGHGPQGDVIRIKNYVRLVRGGNSTINTQGPALEKVQNGSSNRSHQQNKNGADSHFNRLDKNNDGKISRSEFDGPAEHFDHMDKNKDGSLSSDELKPPSSNSSRRPRSRRGIK
ncbi:DUF1566 domain-containing protein [Lentisphaerota bacterium WC36G]|nr:DUF1566 domain-containing protein [Lentisphaerae bacterium WC36]